MIGELKNKKLKALTLVEILMYLALFGLIFATLLNFALSTGEFNRKNVYRTELDKSIIFLNEHFHQSISSSIEVDDTNSIFNNNNGKLVLNSSSGNTIYKVQSGRLVVEKSSIDYPITGVDYIVNEFRVEQVIQNASDIAGVRVTIDISSTKDSSLNRRNTTSYVLR